MAVSLDRIEKVVDLVSVGFQCVLIRKIEDKSDWKHAPYTLLPLFTYFLDVEKELVFARYA